MKKIGGISPESTLDYYRGIIDAFQELACREKNGAVLKKVDTGIEKMYLSVRWLSK